MGCSSSSGASSPYSAASTPVAKFKLIPDQYTSYEQLTAALRQSGLEKSQLLVGIDFTKSNLDTGQNSFGGRPLHDVSDPSSPNPYHQALTVIAKALWDFDDDHMIPVYGFGDAQTGNCNVFSFQKDDKPCKGLVQCQKRYEAIAAVATLSGPTSFAPLIRQAVKIVRDTSEYHILLIVADGQVSPTESAATANAIVEASSYALSIVMVGVGDGPWDLMDRFDDELPERRFDNFQFVDFSKVFSKYPTEKRETAFATHALMEVPDQYQAIKRLNLLNGPLARNFQPPPAPFGPPDNPAPGDPSYGLPSGWTAVWDYRQSAFFYLNTATGQTVWDRPGAATRSDVGQPGGMSQRRSLA